MTSLFPRLSSPTYHLCLLLPFSALYPSLLPFLLGASLPYTSPTPIAALRLFLFSLLLDGHALATSRPDNALSSRLPPFHFDPRRTSGLLQLAAVAAIPVLLLLRGARPARLHPTDAAGVAALLALLSLASAHFLLPSLAPISAEDPIARETPIVDEFLHFLNGLIPRGLSLHRAGATFGLRRALREFFTLPTELPVDAAGVQRAITAAVLALLGAIDECSYLNDAGWLDAATSAAGVAAAGWMFVVVVEGEGIGGRLAALAMMMLTIRAARRLSAVKTWRDVLRPIAAVGANWVCVWIAVEFGLVEMVMDAVRINSQSSLLSVVRGICEVLGAGEGEIAENFFLIVKMVTVLAVSLAWEGSLDFGWAASGNERRLGDRLFGAQ